MSDPLRQYTIAEEERLALSLREIEAEVQRGALRDRPFTVGLLCDIHRALFRGVRDHAGRHRERTWGAEYLTFGPNRSVHRSEVTGELEIVFDRARSSVSSFDAHPDQPDYEEQALQLAVWTHAEIVRVHPFEDGNGRSARVVMNWILVRVGLRPIAFEVPKQEYRDCLNHFYKTREIQPLLDLAQSLYRC